MIFPADIIRKELKIPLCMSNTMTEAISLWTDLFLDEPPWRFDPEEPMQSLGIAVSVAGEYARLATIEMKSEITGSERGEYLNQVYQNVLKRLRVQTEYGCAKGGLIFKPYLSGAALAVDYVQADYFYPTAFDGSGRITGVIFLEKLVRGNQVFRRLEYHHLESQGCVIENLAFVSRVSAWGDQAPTLGKQIALSEVTEWSSLESKVVLEGVDRLLVGYFKMPLANHVDPDSPLGVSAFSRAVDLIHQADAQWTRILWEYEGAELAIHADRGLFKKDKRGELELPKHRERLYRTLPAFQDEGISGLQTFSPEIRDHSLFNGLNNMLRRIEFQCALAYGTLSDPQNVDKTAEEIKSSKQRSYATIKDVQKALQTALEDFIYAMNQWVTIGSLAPQGEYQTTFHWDDSIVADKQMELNDMRQDVAAGLLRPELYVAKRYGVSEEEAKNLMPKAADLLEE